MDKIRCTGCRGVKQVPGLGGMVGDCNLCKGSGKINECDRPKITVVEPELSVAEIKDAVVNSTQAEEIPRAQAYVKPQSYKKKTI